MKYILLSFIVLCLASCGTQHTTSNQANSDKGTPRVMSPAEGIILQAVEAHGGDLYDQAHFGFVFRKKNYTFHNQDDQYTYSVTKEKDGETIVDKLTNSSFTRTVDGKATTLTEKQVSGYSEGLNSVIYFATLPHKLKDKAVNKSLVAATDIKGQSYDVIHVTFDEEGGGKDHDDNFYYWINRESKRIDFLAYNYKVGKGGVRFRSAYNPRLVGGVLFQDYVNYKAEIGTPLADLPTLWEANQLKELSRIDTEDVKVIK